MIYPDDRSRIHDLTIEAFEEGQAVTREYRIIHKQSKEIRWLEDKIVPYFINGKVVSFYGIARDITEQKLLQEERDRLIGTLQDSLNKAMVLHEILPICSSCKKIRDNCGAWHRLETFMQTRTGVRFGHGLCEECVRKLYPDMADELLPR